MLTAQKRFGVNLVLRLFSEFLKYRLVFLNVDVVLIFCIVFGSRLMEQRGVHADDAFGVSGRGAFRIVFGLSVKRNAFCLSRVAIGVLNCLAVQFWMRMFFVAESVVGVERRSCRVVGGGVEYLFGCLPAKSQFR